MAAAKEVGLNCEPFRRTVKRFLYLSPALWEMAEYWCLCVKYAGRCEEGGGCPVDPAKCAAAYVATMAARGSAVRENFYVFLRGKLPPRFYAALARAASRLFSRLAEDGYILYEDLVVEAVSYFMTYPPPKTLRA